MTTKDPAAVALGMRRWANRTPHPCANGCGRQTLRAYCSPACKQQAYRRRSKTPTEQQLDQLAAALGFTHSQVLATAVNEMHATYADIIGTKEETE